MSVAANSVITDGRLVLGLHQAPQFAALTFVHPELAQLADALEADGVELALRRTDPEEFNQLEFADPDGQKIRMVAARRLRVPGWEAQRRSEVQ